MSADVRSGTPDGGDGPGPRGARPPDRPVVIFDGRCGLCMRWLGRLRNWDRDDSFEYLPFQDPAVPGRFPHVPREEFEKAMHLIEPDGTTVSGADAVERILDRLPRGFLLSWLFRLPFGRMIARRVYRWVAENRSKLGCSDHCGGDAEG